MKPITACMITALLLAVCSLGTGCQSTGESSQAVSDTTTAETTAPDSAAATEDSTTVTSTSAEADSAVGESTDEPENTDGLEDLLSTETTTAAAADTMDEASIQLLGEDAYERACETIFSYFCTTDGEFALDYNTSVEPEPGQIAYLVVDPRISSVDDVQAEFHKTFSASYPEDPGHNYLTQDGKLYRMGGDRGSDITYMGSELALKSHTADKLVFDAVSHYCDPEDYSLLPDKTQEFTLVLENGAWLVSAFTLPY